MDKFIECNHEEFSSDQKQLIREVLDFLTEFFEEVKSKPCGDPGIALKNRKQYVNFENESFHLMVHSRYEYASPEVKGWSFTIAQVELDERFRRCGVFTFIIKWILRHMPMSFLFVECVNTESMENFVKKINAKRTLYSEHNYFILK